MHSSNKTIFDILNINTYGLLSGLKTLQQSHPESICLSRDKLPTVMQPKPNPNSKVFCEAPTLTAVSKLLNHSDNAVYEMIPPDTQLKPYFDLEMSDLNMPELAKYYKIYDIDIITSEQDDNASYYKIYNAGNTYDEIDDKKIASSPYDNAIYRALVNEFINWVSSEIYRVYDIKLERADYCLMTSCRFNKLSYHVVIQNKIAFENNKIQAKWIAQLTTRFQNPIGDLESELFNRLSYIHASGKEKYIFDAIPYGNWQNFRCVNQSKMATNFKLTLDECSTHFEAADTLVRMYNGVDGRYVITESHMDTIVCDNKRKRDTKGDKRNVRACIEKESINIGFNLNGATLFEKYKPGDATFVRFPQWKKHLYLIPNTSQSWAIYSRVAMAVFAAKGKIDDFIEWAKLANNFDSCDDIIRDFKRGKFRTNASLEITLDVTYLKYLAKLANPAAYTDWKSRSAAFFNLDMDNIEVLEENSQFVSQVGTPDEAHIFHPNKYIIIHAYLGRGKTTAIKRLINDPIAALPKVLFLSSRITFARFIAADFNIPCYLTNSLKSNRLVMSMESLWKLDDDMQYDAIIVDESESMLMQFSSETMGGRQVQIFNKLVRFMNRAKKVVFADAFLTNRTVDFVRDIAGENPIAFIKNESPPRKRIAEEVNDKQMPVDIIKNIQSGMKPYVFFASATTLVHTNAMLKGAAITDTILEEKIESGLVYHASANDEVFENLSNINKSWGEASYVFTSPSNTIGCSYSPDAPPDFNNIWIQAQPTCCVRDQFQAHLRVRHTISDTIYYSLPCQQGLNLGKKNCAMMFDMLSAFELHTEKKRDYVIDLVDKLIVKRLASNCDADVYDLQQIKGTFANSDHTPAALKHIFHANLFEQNLSACYFKEMFQMFLTRCGYSRSGEVAKADVNKIEEMNENVKYDAKYSIEELTINSDEITRLQNLKKSKKATTLQKKQIDFYYFSQITNENPHSMSDFYDQWAKCHTQYTNAYIESTGDVQRALKHDINKQIDVKYSGFENNALRAVQFDHITDITCLLNIKKTYIPESGITRKNIQSAIDYISSNNASINTSFKLGKNKTLTFTTGMKKLNAILGTWSLSGLVGSADGYNSSKKTYSLYANKSDITESMDVQNLFKTSNLNM